MLKIKLQPIGRKKYRLYRVVVCEDRSSRDGEVAEFIGRYDPKQKPLLFEIDLEKVEKWIKNGAQMTDTVASLIKRSKEGKFEELNKRKKVSKHKKARAAEAKEAEAKAKEENKAVDKESKPEDQKTEDVKIEEKPKTDAVAKKIENSANSGKKEPKAKEKKKEPKTE